ncbi:MAG: DegT/DnrJ/EryC1/StrS family aminotransferase [Cyclobacteriaceae bacterium]|nr:DegT/DnrJ/EryC1/StrS family aminotransferase [Cyclobacteriaceae bacterium]
MRVPLSYTTLDQTALSAKLASLDNPPHTLLVPSFEQALADRVDAKHVVAVQSGTAAIHLALRALGVAAGDVVMTSTFTYVASVNPITYLGAEPVLIDSEPTTWNMDPVLLEQALASETRQGRRVAAILVVHSYGMPARMNDIRALAAHYGVPVLEDAAEAIGSTVAGRWASTLGDVGVLSFNSNKLLTAFGGGAIVTNDGQVASRCRTWAAQARKETHVFYQHEETGYNYRMSPLTALAGLCGLDALDENLRLRQRVFDRYRDLLKPSDGFETQWDNPGALSNRWLSCFVNPLLNSKLDTTYQRFAQAGIEVRYLWNPMHRQPLFARQRTHLNGTSDRLFNTGFCLPSSAHLTPQDQTEIASVLMASLNS